MGLFRNGDSDHFHEECGVFGLFGHSDAAAHTVLGLHALQHRGQEAAGIVSFDGKTFSAERSLGLVGDHLSDAATIRRLPGHSAIGHTRYATTGDTVLRNVQPLFADLDFGGFAVAHNGNLTNAYRLREELVSRGSLFYSTTDTEVFTHLMATAPRSRYGVIDRLIYALKEVEGAYSLVALADNMLIGVRDPLGVRPLLLGQLGPAWILTSESCALDIIGARFVRDLEPGEIAVITCDGVQSIKPFPKTGSRFCVFEYIYFARPDSLVGGISVYEARKQIGRELAKECPVDADIVVPVPDSGVPAAIGFASESGISFDLGIIRNHYVGRTFIEPTDQIRNFGVKLKHNANPPVLSGKRVVLVDDSIVRGTTSRKIVEMVRAAGAKEVHLRISSPPTKHPCFYGIDTPERSKLLAATHSLQEMADLLNVDSLGFISIEGLYRAMGESHRSKVEPQYCDACFTGDYPIALIDQSEGQCGRQLSLLTEQAS